MEPYDLPLVQARLHLARGNPADALVVLNDHKAYVTAKHWHDERLRVLVLLTLVCQQHGYLDEALVLLKEALLLAAPVGFIRIFIDEGVPMRDLLSQAAARGIMPDYTRKLLAAFEPVSSRSAGQTAQPLIEPLSERELEVLQLVADGLSNREISERLFIALSTVKGHNRVIYEKLGVSRRTEAVARARELGLI